MALMPSLKDLKDLLPELVKKYGDYYFVFIAPAPMSRWRDSVWSCVKDKRQPPDNLLRGELDIFYANHEQLRNSKTNGDALPLKRHSLGEPTNI